MVKNKNQVAEPADKDTKVTSPSAEQERRVTQATAGLTARASG